jgi:hypothetical protein
MPVPARCFIAFALLLLAAGAAAQQPYQPKFNGDPAHSNDEFVALGYMHTLVDAQRKYFKKHSQYTKTLSALAGSGSFTRRMVSPDRPGYNVSFHSSVSSSHPSFFVQMTPKQFDAAHRAFWVNENGIVRAESDKPATADSPVLHPDP